MARVPCAAWSKTAALRAEIPVPLSDRHSWRHHTMTDRYSTGWPFSTSNLDELAAHQRYWEALGRFIDLFAGTEAIMQLVLWRYANVPTDTARAIFSGVRLKEAIGYIKRIIEVSDPDKEKVDDLL